MTVTDDCAPAATRYLIVPYSISREVMLATVMPLLVEQFGPSNRPITGANGNDHHPRRSTGRE